MSSKVDVACLTHTKMVWLMFILLKSVKLKKKKSTFEFKTNEPNKKSKQEIIIIDWFWYTKILRHVWATFKLWLLWATSVWAWKKLVTQVCKVIHYCALNTFNFSDTMQEWCLLLSVYIQDVYSMSETFTKIFGSDIWRQRKEGI